MSCSISRRLRILICCHVWRQVVKSSTPTLAMDKACACWRWRTHRRQSALDQQAVTRKFLARGALPIIDADQSSTRATYKVQKFNCCGTKIAHPDNDFGCRTSLPKV